MKKITTLLTIVVTMSSCTGKNMYIVKSIGQHKQGIVEYHMVQVWSLAPAIQVLDSVGKFNVGDTVKLCSNE